jgi:hypothetical protein
VSALAHDREKRSSALAERMKYANATPNTATLRKKALAIFCTCSSLILRKCHRFTSSFPTRVASFHVTSLSALNAPAVSALHLRSSQNLPVLQIMQQYARELLRVSLLEWLSSSRNRSHRPRLAAIPTGSVPNSGTSHHKDRRRRRRARPRRQSGDDQIDGTERTQSG